MARHDVCFLALAAVAAWAPGPVGAASGIVVDDVGKPIQGASACLVGGGVELLCVETDPMGFYKLPDSQVTAVRITKRSFVPVHVAVVEQEAPIALARAAALRLRVVDDRTAAPVGGGHAIVIYSSGRQIQPLPFNQGGLSVPTIEPGDALVRVDLAGYEQVGGPAPTALRAGEETAITIRVRPVARSGPSSSEGS